MLEFKLIQVAVGNRDEQCVVHLLRSGMSSFRLQKNIR